jgi:formate hydrogenlyase transcriptional activator
LRDLLQEISASIRGVMQCNSVGVALPDPENGELRIYARDFQGHQQIVDSRPALSSTEQVFRTGQAVHLTKEQIVAGP